MLCQVEVNNCEKDVEEYIVARWDKVSCSLWFYGSYETEKRANEVAKTIDGIVVRRTDEKTA